MNDHSNWLLLEISQSVLVGLHGPQDLLDGVAGQHHEVHQQQRPEDVDFYHLEVGAHCAHYERKSCTLPDIDFAERTRQRLILRVLQVESHSLVSRSVGRYLLSERKNGLIFLFPLILVLCDSARREVADEELQEVEADEVGGDVVGSCLDSLKIGEDEDKSSGPSGFAVECQLVYEAVIKSSGLADRPCN